jgi:hypothetical protein
LFLRFLLLLMHPVAQSSDVTLPPLLGECLAFDIKAGDLAGLRSQLFAPGVFNGVLELAAEENILARLAERFLEFGLVPPGRPGPQDVLRQHLASHQDRSDAMARHLGEIAAVLNGLGIRPVLLKGARSLWEQRPTWRYLRDIDLLVRDGEAHAAQEALAAIGYGPDPDLPTRPDRHHLAPLYREGFPGWIEIHRSGGNRYAERLLPTSELFAVSTIASDNGVSVGLLAPAIHVLHTVVHHHVGHSGDARGTMSLKGLYEFAWAVNELTMDQKQWLVKRSAAHPRLAAMLDYWLAAASLLFRLPVEAPFFVRKDAAARADKVIRGDSTSRWKYPGYSDEIRMAWADERLRRSSGGSGLLGRQLLRWKVIASMLPTISRQIRR